MATTWTAPAARLMRLAPLALAVALAGCASDNLFVFADSGKYQYHSCEQLAAAAKSQSTRERDLKELIDKAEKDAGGVVVSMMAYRADHRAVSEDLRVIES